MDWQTRRKVLYFLATLFTLVATTVYLMRDTIFPAPTCFDNKQNGFEIGVDCGGTCSLRCSSEVVPLSVLWVRSLPVSGNRYDFVGMVSNKNINNAAHEVSYTFSLYGADGSVVQEIKGTTATPINGDFPIVRQSISILKPFKSVVLTLGDGSHYSVHEKTTSPTVITSNPEYSVTDRSRVYVAVQNRKLMTIRDLPVNVILYDENNNAYAVGSTVIPTLGKEEIKKAVFVWETPLPFAPTRIRVYPIFDPFLALQ